MPAAAFTILTTDCLAFSTSPLPSLEGIVLLDNTSGRISAGTPGANVLSAIAGVVCKLIFPASTFKPARSGTPVRSKSPTLVMNSLIGDFVSNWSKSNSGPLTLKASKLVSGCAVLNSSKLGSASVKF